MWVATKIILGFHNQLIEFELNLYIKLGENYFILTFAVLNFELSCLQL
ncbi:MAG: hypothetical protein RLZZ42_282 [Bacteroidota bacterium]